MPMIKGITVTLVKKIKTGNDPLGNPIYDEVKEDVDNILIAPTSSDDVTNQLSLTGKKAVYTLAIPKKDNHVWKDREVIFFNNRWKTVGIPIEGIDELIPLSWNKKVTVERYE